jgi:hypothetical protein
MDWRWGFGHIGTENFPLSLAVVIGATTTDAFLSAPPLAPLVKLNIRYEIVSHNKFSIGVGPKTEKFL